MAGVADYELIVVGAGPAGAAAALAALRMRPAARVLLLDRAPLGRDKVCGDGIAPHAVAQLEELGVSAVVAGELVPSVRLVSPRGTGSVAVTTSPGYVVPRRVFDERVARAAVAAGAEFRQNRVTSLVQDAGGVVVNGLWKAPVVIGADGANSIVRRLAGEPANRGAALAVALRGYAPTPAGFPKELVIRWDSHRMGGLCYPWAFPASDGTTNVGYGMSSAAVTDGRAQLEARLRALLPDVPVGGVPLVGHTLPLSITRPRPAVGRVLLTGDAASLINPLTGEGIFSALVSGALAGAAAVQDPASAGRVYARGLARRFGRQHRQTETLYPLLDSPLVLDAVVRACSRDPRLFARFLDVGLGDGFFTTRDVARFGLSGLIAARPA